MKCTKVFLAEYTSKTSGEVTPRAFAQFDNGQQLMFALKPEDVKAKITEGNTLNDVIVVDGQYGKYAAFGQKVVETLL